MATCLRCGPDTVLVPASGALGESACARCGGRLLLEPTTSSLFVDELGLTREELMDGLPTHERCPSCDALRLAFIEVHGTPATICGACGAAWLDDGVLGALTHGRIVEVRPAARPEAVAIVSRRVVDGHALAPLFERAAFRTAADARLIGGGHGLIVERARRAEAERLLAVLMEAGVEAQIVDANEIAMPVTKTVVQLALEEEGFVVVDQQLRRETLAYDDVVVAAVGVVRFLKVQRGPERATPNTLGRFLGGRPLTSSSEVMARNEGPIVDVVCAGARLRATAASLQLKREKGVTQETAFRDVVRSLFLRLPDRALTPSAHALSSSALTRLEHHAPREWEYMMSWERWRSITPPSS